MKKTKMTLGGIGLGVLAFILLALSGLADQKSKPMPSGSEKPSTNKPVQLTKSPSVKPR